ncbi:Gfo/Idh/MocA family oxidoreductase [Parapedobacter sp. ISTM3]|uniref:Gfo/Idh/MocA family protein n=1 Tax=Parapedobacter sp. ISTM3 TaxID=2800130 RepID=UPI001903B5A2|nr:Gfo/Idh/MocA family oxidoreductase [Parapedobacter sp. ISTM3]MBK1441855.1 Gfo/Idh/MocA family oxidoreductase [Parapedobacter sp. ISTM3]
MKTDNQHSRRNFLKKMASTAVAASVAPTILLPRNGNVLSREIAYRKTFGANDHIQIGLIGGGIQGTSNMESALKVPGVKLMAVADLYDGRLVRAKELYGHDMATTKDYREILNRPDIDAVVVAVPDHLHAQIGIEALKAGKALYCEKPMTKLIEEGHALIKAAHETKQLVQVGSQRVSSIIYAKARELFRAGAIGELNLVEAYYDRHSAQGAWQYSLPLDASPETVDWDRFLSDKAPKIPFDPLHFFRWRNYQRYGTGVAGDLFVHLFSGIHFVLDSKGPNRIMTSGGLRYWKDGRDVPDLMVGIYDYPKTESHPEFTLTLRVNFADGSGGGQQFRFIGSEGQMIISGRGVSIKKKRLAEAPGYTINTFPEAMQEAFLKTYHEKYPAKFEVIGPQEEEYTAPREYSDSYDHFANFFNAIRNKTGVVEDAVFGLRAAGPALLSNTSHFERKIVHWNPETMVVERSATT